MCLKGGFFDLAEEGLWGIGSLLQPLQGMEPGATMEREAGAGARSILV